LKGFFICNAVAALAMAGFAIDLAIFDLYSFLLSALVSFAKSSCFCSTAKESVSQDRYLHLKVVCLCHLSS